MTGEDRVAFLRSMHLRDSAPRVGYPFDLPAIGGLGDVRFAPVTVFVGENGSGKSTIVEAVALAAGFNAEGGSKNLRFKTYATHSQLGEHLALRWAKRPNWGWFLRAETFYGMASHIAQDDHPDYGVAKMFPDLHGRSHGESFLTLIEHRFDTPGLYVMDEPESALSFQGQLRLLRLIHDGLQDGSQFVLATHSPLLMRMPGAIIYELDDNGIRSCEFEQLAVVNLWRRFLTAPERVLDVLLSDDD
jgi:predicted ATPase